MLAVSALCDAVHLSVAWLQVAAPRLVAEDSANNYLPSQSSEGSGATDSPASTPSAAEAELAQGPFLRVSVPAASAELEAQAEAQPQETPHAESQSAPQTQRQETLQADSQSMPHAQAESRSQAFSAAQSTQVSLNLHCFPLPRAAACCEQR